MLAFTGFTCGELLSSENPHIRRTLDATDLLIDGPFIQKKLDLSRPWVGSSNQQFWFLTARYTEKDLEGIENQIEVRIAPNGKILINGMGDFSKIKKLL